MWQGHVLATEGTPESLPATISFDNVAMSCLVTSPATLLAEPRAERETPQMAGDVLPAFEVRGRISPSGFANRRPHPRDPAFLDNLINGLAPSCRFSALCSRKVSASAAAPVCPSRP